MTGSNRERQLLIESLIREASDVDLICYLARTEGPSVVQELLEAVADAHALSEEDLLFNLQVNFDSLPRGDLVFRAEIS